MKITRLAWLLAVAFCMMLAMPSWGQGQDLAPTPPMGWNSWNHFAERVDDRGVRAAADALVTSGMKDAGYVYINIDDTWEGQRDAAGVIHPMPSFPT